MTHTRDLIERTYDCPVCEEHFTSMQVRHSAKRVVKRDQDLRSHFKTVNPMYYAPVICPACGYANFQRDFGRISREEAERVRTLVSSRWKPRSYGGHRGLKDAVIVHKLMLLSLTTMGASSLTLGKICLRLYWFLGDAGQDEEREKYLQLTLDHLERAYFEEHLDETGGEEIQTLYLLGELSRIGGRPREAVGYFAKLMEHPTLHKHRHIKILARDQWQLAASDYRRGSDESR